MSQHESSEKRRLSLEGMEGKIVPTSIGKYQVQEMLGEGAMGVVYRAMDPEIQRSVAIKILKPDAVRRFNSAGDIDLRQEAQSLGRLRHPNIMAVYDMASFDGVPYMVVEYLQGRSLRLILDQHELLPTDMKIFYLAQAAQGLDYAHGMGVIHCDVKPANFIVDPSTNTLFVTDFGIARFGQANVLHAGSPRYMSPEQIAGEPLDGKSDQFSLAGVAFELLTGVRPFVGDDVDQVLAAVLNGDRRRVEEFRPQLNEVEPIFDRALSSDPSERYPNCSSFVSELSKALKFEDPTATIGRVTPVRIPASVRAKYTLFGTDRPGALNKLYGAGLLLLVAALIGVPAFVMLPSKSYVDPYPADDFTVVESPDDFEFVDSSEESCSVDKKACEQDEKKEVPFTTLD